MHLQESGEMYLETIYILSQKQDFVRSLDVAEYMHFSKPSVSRAVGLLKSGNYLVVDGNGHLILVDEAIATDDACRIEHYISDISFEAIKKHFFEKTPSDK